MTPAIPTVKVMWKLEEGIECGLVIQVFESDTDESLKDRAWVLTGLISPEIRPRQKSDLRVIRRKIKK